MIQVSPVRFDDNWLATIVRNMHSDCVLKSIGLSKNMKVMVGSTHAQGLSRLMNNEISSVETSKDLIELLSM